MKKNQEFKKLFVEEDFNKILSAEEATKLGLTKHEFYGKVYYIFNGTFSMLTSLPIR